MNAAGIDTGLTSIMRDGRLRRLAGSGGTMRDFVLEMKRRRSLEAPTSVTQR